MTATATTRALAVPNAGRLAASLTCAHAVLVDFGTRLECAQKCGAVLYPASASAWLRDRQLPMTDAELRDAGFARPTCELDLYGALLSGIRQGYRYEPSDEDLDRSGVSRDRLELVLRGAAELEHVAQERRAQELRQGLADLAAGAYRLPDHRGTHAEPPAPAVFVGVDLAAGDSWSAEVEVELEEVPPQVLAALAQLGQLASPVSHAARERRIMAAIADYETHHALEAHVRELEADREELRTSRARLIQETYDLRRDRATLRQAGALLFVSGILAGALAIALFPLLG